MNLLLAGALFLAVGTPSPAKFSVEYDEAPDVKEWAQKARELCEKWYPVISDLLASKDFTPPQEVRLVFREEKKGIAYTSGAKITIVADWIRKHPEDFGMVIHELCHVVQSYPGGVGWITEGIADYVRYFKFEPKPAPPKISSKASYKEGYKTTATFFAWIEKSRDGEFIKKLNALLRENRYTEKVFKDWTGEDLETLWKDFITAQ